MQHLAARTQNCPAVCLHAGLTAALREFWTDWLPTKCPSDVVLCMLCRVHPQGPVRVRGVEQVRKLVHLLLGRLLAPAHVPRGGVRVRLVASSHVPI